MGQRDLALARHFKSLVEQKVAPREIRLFGSRARGGGTEDSDLDIFVSVSNCTREIEKYISECAWEAGFPEDVIVVPVVIDQEKLGNGPLRDSAFIRNVFREGIPV
jgi:predicted nucleotidyltransferase